MKNSVVVSKKAPEPVGAYPHARKVGDFIFLSGVGPRKPGTSNIPGVQKTVGNLVQWHDVSIQTESVIENIRIILAEFGAKLENIVDVAVYLTDMKNDFAAFNKIYAKHFAHIQATRTTVEVGALPTPIAVEFKVIAYVGPSTT
jgi:2-aminomuconate deaminase